MNSSKLIEIISLSLKPNQELLQQGRQLIEEASHHPEFIKELLTIAVDSHVTASKIEPLRH